MRQFQWEAKIYFAIVILCLAQAQAARDTIALQSGSETVSVIGLDMSRMKYVTKEPLINIIYC